MGSTIEVPQFDWTAFYYPQILEALISFKRIYCPEHTDESPQDPLIQLLRACACVGHLNSVNTDIIANENTLPTAKLPETIRNMLRLIDYELASAAPAFADIIFKLSAPLTAATVVIPAYSQISTKRTATETAVVFELLSSLTVERSDYGYIQEVLVYTAATDTFVDYTAEANTAGMPMNWTPWAIPAAGDILYIGNEEILFDQLGIGLPTPGAGIAGVWEVYDGDFLDAKPDSATAIGVQLQFVLNNLLGAEDRSGAMIRVQLDRSGVWEEVVSAYAFGQNYILTSSLLGQVGVISESANDYTVGCVWKEIEEIDDGTSDLSVEGDVTFTLPESFTEKWVKGEVNGDSMYWLRYRIISATAPTPPTISTLRIDEGSQYVKISAIQGQRQIDSSLGFADGITANLSYAMSKDGFIDDSETVTVATVQWVRVDNFLQSVPTDRHYQIVLGENDRASILFGNGINGAIPSGQVAAEYRYGITDNGNVGASTIIVDKSGLASFSELWNPRPAVGWQEAQSASSESLEIAKVLGPASLRVLGEVALGPEDVEILTVAYRDPDTNTRPFLRSSAIEEGFGPKTIKNVVVASGGGVASAEALAELDRYFNGDATAVPPLRKRLVANQELTSINYTPKSVDISATVTGAFSLDLLEAALTALLQPDATQDDGVTFEWQYQDVIYPSRIHHEIHRADSNVTVVENLLINGVSTPLALNAEELPVAGTITLVAGP